MDATHLAQIVRRILENNKKFRKRPYYGSQSKYRLLWIWNNNESVPHKIQIPKSHYVPSGKVQLLNHIKTKDVGIMSQLTIKIGH